MIDPGRLNRRLVVEAPMETPDGAGGVIRAFVTVATQWAEVMPLAARADTEAASTGAVATHRILVRAGVEITTRHRLRLDAREFRIVALREQDRTGRFVEIFAEERVA
ncbi:MAG: phage head closure protein [Xanthobacteraceae bacterium]